MNNQEWKELNKEKINEIEIELSSLVMASQEIEKLDQLSQEFIIKSVRNDNDQFYLKMKLEELTSKEEQDFRQERLWSDSSPASQCRR